MHWQLATEVRDVNAADNSAFTINACSRTGNATQVIKQVTCKVCKPLTKSPQTPTQVANLLYQKAVAVNATDDWATIHCNGCEGCNSISSEEFEYEAQWVSIGKITTLLGHVAYDHAFGTEVQFSVHTVPFTVYELNWALGKAPQTQHEEDFRERNGWVRTKELA